MAMTVCWTSRQGLKCTDANLSDATCDEPTLSVTVSAIIHVSGRSDRANMDSERKELGLSSYSQI